MCVILYISLKIPKRAVGYRKEDRGLVFVGDQAVVFARLLW
jgi:hypothetical protein